MTARRSTMFLEKLRRTRARDLEELRLRRKYSSSQYYHTLPAVAKILVVAELTTDAALFLSSTLCQNTASWYGWVYPTGSLFTAALNMGLYLLFVLGLAEINPKPWVLTDVCLTVVEAVLMAVISILTMVQCSSNDTHHVILGPLGLVGAVLLMVSATASYIMYRRRDDEELPASSRVDGDSPPPPRKSFFI
ncbi:uncharacterized protein LOC134540235 [Bacillus rossius redtenbacheri]|uniref:uncharacterized protein LOC134540235 n=1 Tax=Bacillus rossius redtenbacheri TaxID=93214 RepID=UPI002FDD9983